MARSRKGVPRQVTISQMHVQHDERVEDLGEGLTDGEYFFWQEQKRNENLSHRGRGHTFFCPACKNCLCDDPSKRFKCICASGKIWATPYRIRMRGLRK
jgi:hypothetical protein